VRPSSLRLLASNDTGVHATCRWKCGSGCFRPPPNRSGNEPFASVAARALRRRAVLKGALAATVVLGTGCRATQPGAEPPAASPAGGQPQPTGQPLTFRPIEPNVLDEVVLPSGYGYEVLISWGDPIVAGAPTFDFSNQTPQTQAGQFGYNCDFLAFLPGGGPSQQGVLWVNHEYTNPEIMFGDWNPEAPTEQVNIELAAHGGSVVAVERVGENRYRFLTGHRLNRRITAETPIMLTGPAAGADLLKTSEDPTGTRVRGMLNNCAGGVTPWGTILTCEENFDQYFGNLAAVTDPRVRALHDRIGFAEGPSGRLWERHHARFDLGQAPNEPFRFGWVIEIDPFDPSFTPLKRTALGRFKHEGAASRLARDGRVAFYLGDDQRFEYVYKFLTADQFREGDRAHNLGLLDDGVLYAARFNADGDGEWIPLIHGERGLTADNGLTSQADVLINPRGAADLLKATPMDRPEEVAVNPRTGAVYVVMTNNDRRGTEGTLGPDAVNPRPNNTAGHVIEILEEDAAANTFRWQLFLVCGNPDDPSTFFAGFPKDQVSPIAAPDNVAFDPEGHLWIATDGQPDALGFNDAFSAVPVAGDDRGHVRMCASVPRGAEATGPCFSPDGHTLFASVQHPGEGGSLTQPLSDWPDRRQPPRPSVITVFKQQGDLRVGS
jgi:secreted PhoX family phosphatase